MKAIQYTAFGDSSVIQLSQVSKPTPQDKEVLIRVTAVTVNPLDIKIRSGFMQKQMPLVLPYIPGLDVSGIVEAVGSDVIRLKPGDEVFGTTFGGTFAEYVSINEDQLATIPNNVNKNEAAALAVPLVTAYTFLVEEGRLQAGQKVLIQGAAGAVGSTMVQMAKEMGAYVIGTASGEGIALLESFRTDQVIDYKTQDFTQVVKDVDLVLDLVGGEIQAKSFEVLKKGGLLLSTVMPPSAELAQKFGVNARFANSSPSYKKLEFGKRLVEQGKIKAQIARTLSLADAAQAQDLVTGGGINGKVVLETNTFSE